MDVQVEVIIGSFGENIKKEKLLITTTGYTPVEALKEEVQKGIKLILDKMMEVSNAKGL